MTKANYSMSLIILLFLMGSSISLTLAATTAEVNDNSMVSGRYATVMRKSVAIQNEPVVLNISELGDYDSTKVGLTQEPSAPLRKGQILEIYHDQHGMILAINHYWDGIKNHRVSGFVFTDRSVNYYADPAAVNHPYNTNNPDYLAGISNIFNVTAMLGPTIIADKLVPLINEMARAQKGQDPAEISLAPKPVERYHSHTFRLIADRSIVNNPIKDPKVGVRYESDTLRGDYVINSGSGQPVIYRSPVYGVDWDGQVIIPPAGYTDTLYVDMRISNNQGSISNKLSVPIIFSAYDRSVYIRGSTYSKIKVGNMYHNNGTISPDDRRAVTITVKNLPEWATYEQGTVVVTGTPGMEHRGKYEYSITVSDGISSNSESFRIKVTDNDAPILPRVPLPLAVEGEPYFYTFTATDSDGDSLHLEPDMQIPKWLTLTVNQNKSCPGKLVLDLSSNGTKITADNLLLTNDNENNGVMFTVKDNRDMPELEEYASFGGYLIKEPSVTLPNKRNETRKQFVEVHTIHCVINRNTIQINLKGKPERVQLFNALGKLVNSSFLNATSVLDIGSLCKGRYFAAIDYRDGTKSGHNIIVR